MGHPGGYFLGTSFSKICNFNREFKTKSFRGQISIICRSSVAAIYQNKPLSPVSFFNCRNGLFSKRSFYYSAAKVWNEIPPNIRQSPTIYTFKKKLKDFLLNLQRFPKHDP